MRTRYRSQIFYVDAIHYELHEQTEGLTRAIDKYPPGSPEFTEDMRLQAIVAGPDGDVFLNPDDWYVIYPDGKRVVMTNAVFREKFTTHYTK